MKKKTKRFDDGGWAGDDVGKGAATRRLQAANSPSQEERDAVNSLTISTEPKIGPVKDYPKGRDFDSGDEDTSPAVSKPEVSSYGSENRRTAQDTSAPRKAPTVTKEELAASGMSLRDYLNKQQGLTRRGGGDSMPSSAGYRDEGSNRPLSNAEYPTEGANKPARGAIGFGKNVVTDKKGKTYVVNDPMEQGRNADIYGGTINDIKNMFRGRNSPSQAMKKGGTVKMASGGSTSSASRRADGIAQKGKTRGKMC
jgi:hypothetical protein